MGTRTTEANVSVSLDGMQSVNDIARLDHKNNTSFFKVLDGISLLNKHDDLLSGTLSVIHPNTSPKEIYNFFKKLLRFFLENVKNPKLFCLAIFFTLL